MTQTLSTISKAVILTWLLGLLSHTSPIRAAAPPTDGQQTTQEKCSTEAFSIYNKALYTLLQQDAAMPPLHSTVDLTIARRRLQEQFCLQFARCNFPDTSNQSLTVQYSLAFNSCLRDEVLEEYNDK
jgi:hypothetical protein